jgi:hypothetical protein
MCSAPFFRFGIRSPLLAPAATSATNTPPFRRHKLDDEMETDVCVVKHDVAMAGAIKLRLAHVSDVRATQREANEASIKMECSRTMELSVGKTQASNAGSLEKKKMVSPTKGFSTLLYFCKF